MICTLSKHEAEKQGYTDSLMLDHEGNIAEATGANIFFKNRLGELHLYHVLLIIILKFVKQ